MNAEVHLCRKSIGQGSPKRWRWHAELYKNSVKKGYITWRPAARLLHVARREVIEALAHFGFAPSDIVMIVHRK